MPIWDLEDMLGTLPPGKGGTGVNNGSSTITIGGSFTMSGAFTFAGTLTANTAVTFPTSGYLCASGSPLNANRVLYSAASQVAEVPAGSNGDVLTLVSGIPSWSSTPFLLDLSVDAAFRLSVIN